MQGRNEDKIAQMAVNKETAEKTSAEPVEELTIDQLAQRTGMTVRNIRAHQSRGLLPAPAVKGRIGYYDERHIARLELIQQLQAGGFNLTAIKKLVERAELAEQVDFPIDSKLITQAVDMGFAVPLGGDRYEVLSPTLLQSGMRALELGVPVDTLFDVIRKVHTHSRAIAEVFTKMVDNAIVRPEEKKGLPPESFPAVVSAVEGLRPLASEVVMASFRVNMDHAAEEAFGKILQRIAKEDLKTGIQKVEPSNGDKPSSRSRRRKR
jgi:DNA-binding transcriptional MerR regulator